MNKYPSALRLLLCLAILSAVSLARAGDAPDNIWLLSTRALSKCSSDSADAGAGQIDYSRMDEDRCWAPSDAAAFRAADDASPTVVFVHGNQTDPCDAISIGNFAYRTIRRSVGCSPFRYVIWSWPSDRMCRRHRPDAQIKADVSDAEGVWLAQWLNGTKPGAKICLIGHSFGARIIGGAMQMLAGGEVAGNRMPQESVAAWQAGRRNPVRAVFLAAGVEADALAPSGRYCLVPAMFEKMLSTCNPCDRALQFYPRLYGRGGPDALGFYGPCGVGGLENIETINVACTVGRTHDVFCYLSAANLRDRWATFLFLDNAEPAAEAADQPEAGR